MAYPRFPGATVRRQIPRRLGAEREPVWTLRGPGATHKVRVEVRTAAGITRYVDEFEGHSWTLQGLRALKRRWTPDAETITSITGATFAPNGIIGMLTSIDTRGVVIGTSATPGDFNTTALIAKIATGTGAGQMTHGAQTFDPALVAIGTTGTLWESFVQRQFTNGSAGSITVREVGIYASTVATDNSTTNRHLILRDVITDTVVAPTETIIVRYTFSNAGDPAWNRQSGWWWWFCYSASTGGGGKYRDLTGTLDSMPGYAGTVAAWATNPEATIGLRAGTGTPAFSQEVTTFFTLPDLYGIAAAGPSPHSAHVADPIAADAAGGSYEFSRVIANDSGAPFDVQTVGLIDWGNSGSVTNAATSSYLVAGHTYAAPVTLADGEAAEMRCRMELAY